MLKRFWNSPLYALLNMKRSHWNSITAALGAFCLADSFWQFMGIVLVMESLHVTIEGCWGAAMRRREGVDD